MRPGRMPAPYLIRGRHRAETMVAATFPHGYSPMHDTGRNRMRLSGFFATTPS